ncbi:MAG: SdpI family protein [Acidimicrobiales bacterium]
MLGQETISWAGALGLTAAIGLIMVAAGIAVIVVSKRAADGRLKKNRLAGIRTKATLSSDEAWDAAHRAGLGPSIVGGWISIATGIVPVLIGAVLALFDLATAEQYMLVWTVLYVIGVAGLLVAVVLGAVNGNRAAKAVHNPDPLL